MNLSPLALSGLIILVVLLIVVLLALRIIRRRRAAADGAASESGKQKSSAQGSKTKSNRPKKSSKKAKAKTKAKSKSSPPASGAKKPEPTKTADPSDKILGGPTEQERALPAQPKQGYAPAGEKIRILIVDDNTGTRENVSRLLYFEDDLEVIGQAVNGRQGVEMAIELKPHIVLMDINMPDMDGIAATKEMALQAAFSQVIIMSVQSDSHYMKRAMNAGARDFQPKPFTSEELVSCIRRVYNIGLPVYEQFEAIEKAKTEPAPKTKRKPADPEALAGPAVAVYSPKGGAGTSAIATNLAVMFQQQHGDTVLLDGALQTGDISVHLNTRPQRSIADVVYDGDAELDLISDVLLSHHSGLKLLLAPPQPELAETINGKMVMDIIKELKENYKFVLTDTTPQLNDTTLAILEAADYILVITTPELPAIKSVKLFLELAEQLEFDPARLFVVINRADMPGGIKPAQIEKVLQLKHTFRVPNDPKLHVALNRGASICLTEPGAPSAAAITALARDLHRRIVDTEVAVEEAA